MNEPLQLRVVAGCPDDTELAALVAVLVAAASRPTSGPAPTATTGRRPWGHPATLVRRAGDLPPGGWTALRT